MKPVLKNFFRKEILREKAYHLDAHPEAIKLNQNELPYDLPPELKTELLQRLNQLPLQRYPLPQPSRLKERLAGMLQVNPRQIQISNGSNVMIQALTLAASVGGKVMVVDPTFSVYEIEGKILGNRVIQVPLAKKDFGFPLKKFLQGMKAQKPRLIFIPNPNAPTGNLFPREDLLEVVSKAKCPVIIDEAYYQFSRKTLLPELGGFPNLIVLRTFSKGFGLGGVRVGYLVAHEEIAQQVEKVLLPYCLSTVSEAIAHFVLDHLSHFVSVVEEVRQERERMAVEMSLIKAIHVYPSQANFILFRTKNAKKCFDHLLKHGVLVRDVSNKDLLKNCLRVSVGRPEENDEFLAALEKL